jgi:hypothetical protein
LFLKWNGGLVSIQKAIQPKLCPQDMTVILRLVEMIPVLAVVARSIRNAAYINIK